MALIAVRTVETEAVLGPAGTDWTSVVAIISAVLALLGVILGGFLASRAQRRHWRSAEEMSSCADLLKRYSGVYLQLAKASRDGSAFGAQSGADFVEWEPWNEALGVLHLMGQADLVDAAHSMDRALWETSVGLRRGWITREGWPRAGDALDAARLQFVNTARKALVKDSEPLTRLTGRPDPTIRCGVRGNLPGRVRRPRLDRPFNQRLALTALRAPPRSCPAACCWGHSALMPLAAGQQ